MRDLGRHLVLTTLITALLSGCVPTGDSTSSTPGATGSTPTTSTPTATQSVAMLEITPSPSASSATPQPPVEGAYPGAGGPRPAGSVPASALDGDMALIITPSKNIRCALSDHYAGCGISSYVESQPYGTDEFGALWWVPLDQEPVQVTSTPEAPLTEISEVAPQEVPYGTVIHHGTYVCASESAGLTCWNTLTGRGAFMNRKATLTF